MDFGILALVTIFVSSAQPRVQRTRLRRGARLAVLRRSGVADKGSGKPRRAADAIVSPLMSKRLTLGR